MKMTKKIPEPLACNSIKFYNFAVRLSISKKEIWTFLKQKPTNSDSWAFGLVWILWDGCWFGRVLSAKY